MPRKPPKPCSYPNCPELTHERYCDKHKKQTAKDYKTNRPHGYLYNTGRWRTARSRFLKANPLCVRCKDNGTITPATVVDHIKPHRGDKTLFWDENNWQSLCKSCHDKKTMTEDRYVEYKY